MSLSSRRSIFSPGKPGMSTNLPPPVVWQTFFESSTDRIFAGEVPGIIATSATRTVAPMEAFSFIRRESERKSFS